jgi:hypothetical protein
MSGWLMIYEALGVTGSNSHMLFLLEFSMDFFQDSGQD